MDSNLFLNVFYLISVAIPSIGPQYQVFQAAPGTKLMEENKMHPMEHVLNPIAVQTDPNGAPITPPPFQVI